MKTHSELNIRLVALDLDGTIFGDDLRISSRMRRAITDAQESGVTVTISTGRMFRSARMIAADVGISGPIICYQGALVADTATGSMLLHETVPIPLVHSIISDTARMGLHLNVYLDDELYVSEKNYQAEFYARINMGLPMNEVGDLHAWIDAQGGREPTKLVIVTDEGETDSTLQRFTEAYSGSLQVTKSHPRFTEFTNLICSKGRALAFLAERLVVAQESVMAIGDGLNDLDMIGWAGLGVAMGTSPTAVRDAARVISPPLSEDGAALAIEHFVLGKEKDPRITTHTKRTAHKSARIR